MCAFVHMCRGLSQPGGISVAHVSLMCLFTWLIPASVLARLCHLVRLLSFPPIISLRAHECSGMGGRAASILLSWSSIAHPCLKKPGPSAL